MNYHIYMNIRRLFRNKSFHYQVEVAGKYHFLKNLIKIRNHMKEETIPQAWTVQLCNTYYFIVIFFQHLTGSFL